MGNVPVLVVGNLHALDGEGVLILEIVALVHLVIVFTFSGSHRVLTHSFQNDMDKLNIIRTHQERSLVTLQEGLLLRVKLRQFTKELKA